MKFTLKHFQPSKLSSPHSFKLTISNDIHDIYDNHLTLSVFLLNSPQPTKGGILTPGTYHTLRLYCNSRAWPHLLCTAR